jgi:hypothetical protein
MRRARSRLATFLVMIDLHGRSGAEGACGIAIEGIRVASEVRRHGHPSGGGWSGGSQVRDRTERGGRSCARERFKRPRVDRQIDSPIKPVNAPRRRRGSAEGPSRAADVAYWFASSLAPAKRRQLARHAVFRLELRCYPARYPKQKFVSRINGPATGVWSRFGRLG